MTDVAKTWAQTKRARWEQRAFLPPLGNLTIEDLPEALRAQVRMWLATATQDADHGKGLFIYGPPGTGNTTAAALVLREALRGAASQRWLGYCPPDDPDWSASSTWPAVPGLFMPLHTLLRTYYDKIRGDETAETVMYRIFCDGPRWRRTKLLVLDDVGKEYDSGSGFSKASLHALLRDRYWKGCPTIVTTNLSPDDFEIEYGPAMGSFIYEAYDHVAASGKDRRRKK